MNNTNDFKSWMVNHQFSLPTRLNYLAKKYPRVTWEQACNTYESAVRQVLMENNVSTIADMSLIRGCSEIEFKFEEFLSNINTNNDGGDLS